MQGSAGARKYAGEAFLRHVIQAAIEAYPHIPVVTHQDHGQSPTVCMSAIRSGFSHAIGVTVEAEPGVLGSLETMRGDKEDAHGAEGTMTSEQLLTDPDQAADFVLKTQCDALAIAIGTSHGAYEFTREPTGDILAMTGAMRKHMAEKQCEFDPRKFLADAQKAAKGTCRLRYEAFGCAGQASKVGPLTLERMAERYKTPELNQIVRRQPVSGPKLSYKALIIK